MEINYIRRMKSIKGKISIRTISGKSKSDGFISYLETEDGTKYRLSRRGVYDINDDYFLDFLDKSVSVFGEVSEKSGKGWIIV